MTPKNNLAETLRDKRIRPALLMPFAPNVRPVFVATTLRKTLRGKRIRPTLLMPFAPNVRPLLAAANLAETKAVSLGQKCNGLAGLQPAALLHGSLHILLRLIGGLPRQSR